jgi:hypothetical protein
VRKPNGFNESNRAAHQAAEARLQETVTQQGKMKVVGPYINSKTKVAVECLTCAHTWDIYPKNIHAGNGCRPCAAKVNRLPETELIRRQGLKENTALVAKFNRLVERYKKVRDDALKYTSRSSWQNNSKSSYNSALRYGWLGSLCGHMQTFGKPDGWWTYERCLESARQYSLRSAWRSLDSGAHASAVRNGWLEDCCVHMTNGKSNGSDLPAQVYILEHWTPQGTVVNVGCTKQPLRGRYKVSQLMEVSRRYVLPYRDSSEARSLEQGILARLSNYSLAKGETVVGKTGKELFSCTFEQAMDAMRLAIWEDT